MPGPITPISPSAIPDLIQPSAGTGSSQGGAFQDVFSSAIRDVEGFTQKANASTERFLAGDGEELHSTIMATQQANLAFDLFMQVRNKIVGAYQEVMKMPM
jgi:flagellar hook-basal body complex protein FliE